MLKKCATCCSRPGIVSDATHVAAAEEGPRTLHIITQATALQGKGCFMASFPGLASSHMGLAPPSLSLRPEPPCDRPSSTRTDSTPSSQGLSRQVRRVLGPP